MPLNPSKPTSKAAGYVLFAFNVCLPYANFLCLPNSRLVKRRVLCRNLMPPLAGMLALRLSLSSCCTNLVFLSSPAGKKITSLIKKEMYFVCFYFCSGLNIFALYRMDIDIQAFVLFFCSSSCSSLLSCRLVKEQMDANSSVLVFSFFFSLFVITDPAV